MKLLLGVLLVCVLVLPAQAQGSTSRQLRFEDYPVTDIFRGVPVAPEHPVGPTNIKKETNFAGHYVVIAWAPGGDHFVLDIFDAKTGHIFVPAIPETLYGPIRFGSDESF